MKVIWAPQAISDRDEIWAYIDEDNPVAAAQVDERFSAAAARLASFPELGKSGLIAGTRELTPYNNYRMVYEIAGDEVWILAIVHTSRLWPPTSPQ
ncbi:type II toxin-antitoxin system RelE/ParE family toxin [Gulosibacter molinativorax]|uniref:Type II toxin-antitoxin system RelE/ParE family toxin n=1 Tax=Gulosibacter molinativorax TaxID=256821 RepID=A0ABT7C8A3_9MICO|nr:type II toxin-antitoxin system RelE/ParE family toxin [Gulosibacter molinativorax]QUY62786.1 Plasmid stabilization protein ParE [Gulosibacter molinativorax]